MTSCPWRQKSEGKEFRPSDPLAWSWTSSSRADSERRKKRSPSSGKSVEKSEMVVCNIVAW